MARENQGLQIALIIFVLLTVGLGVSTFMYFRKLEESVIQKKKAESDTENANRVAEDRLTEAKELRKMIGVGETEKLADLQTLFSKDMETWAGAFPVQSRYYRQALEYMFTANKSTSVSLTDAKREIEDWKKKYEEREKSIAPSIKKFEEAMVAAANSYNAERAKQDARVKETTAIQDQMTKKLDEARKISLATTSGLQKKLEESAVDRRNLVTQVRQVKTKINELTQPAPGTFSGEVRWVDQRKRVVWINLGRADRLSRQTTFAVYPADTSDIQKGVKKGSIEVTQILDEHMAEARILDDSDVNPITLGDKINTLTWRPGDQKHFAFTGVMDVKGTGTDDIATVRNLVSMSGGVVDAYLDMGTEKAVGQVTTDTRYIVQGTPPDGRRNPKALAAYTKMLQEADRQGTEKITLSRFLELVGYQNRNPVVRFGPGGNAADLPPSVPAGGIRTSTGTTSDLFKPRTPPRPAGGSAY